MDVLTLTGIGKRNVKTEGSIQLKLEFENKFKIKHKFHTVSDKFQISEDGIIGRDFFEDNKVVISYSDNQIKIGDNLIYFSNKLRKSIMLQARCETVIEIQTPTNELYICSAFEPQPGIFIPNMLLQPQNNRAKIIIANTLPKETELRNFEPQLEQLNYNSYQVTTNNTLMNRHEKLAQIISENIDTTNNVEENISILELRLQYEDIFFLEGDKLSSINGIYHNINLYTDSKPVQLQRYRLLQIHRDAINRQVKEMLDEGKIQPSTSPFNSHEWTMSST